MVREVWSFNLEEEMEIIESIAERYCYVFIDTEFPGFLRNTARDASQLERYQDLKYNVDHLKIIQLGLTFTDENGDSPFFSGGGVWQFNFREFDPTLDDHVPASIELLKKNGIELEKNKMMGVDVDSFAQRFADLLEAVPNLQWVTFHGLYDLAYTVKIMTKGAAMPDTIPRFLNIVGKFFDRVYDIKFIARFCHGLLGGELGLERLAKILDVKRFGQAHQAGSDSLLTACVFWSMMNKYELMENNYEGYLYGISMKIVRPELLFFRDPAFYYDGGSTPTDHPLFIYHVYKKTASLLKFVDSIITCSS